MTKDLRGFWKPDRLGEVRNVKKLIRNRRKESANQTRKAKPDDSFYKSLEWRSVRYLVLKNCEGRCMCCGRSPADGTILHVDHIKPRKTHPHLALTVTNLQVLCSDCNIGKGGWDDTDWRHFKSI